MTNTPSQSSELDMLLGYLEQDPTNASLLADTVQAALDAGEIDTADNLIHRLAEMPSSGQQVKSLAALSAMHKQSFTEAARLYGELLADHPNDPNIRFNLAWCRSKLEDYEGALELLDTPTTSVSPEASRLKVLALHVLGRFDEAAEFARAAMEQFPDHRNLAAATSVLALDVEDVELAFQAARVAGDHPDGLTSLGTLLLGEAETDQAEQLFDRALAAHDQSPRAWIGKGLAQLSRGDNPAEVAQSLDRGADLFKSHLGSWIAAGWAWLVAGNAQAAKARFEQTLEIDPNFSETHGSLAVISIQEGNVDQAKQQVRTALKLDPNSFSGRLAQAMLLAGAANSERATDILKQALTTPIAADGQTIVQMMAKWAR